MRIVVTGGAGFIGSHIVDAYIKAGHQVAILDNFSTGLKKNVHPNARIYRADIRDPKAVERMFAAEKPEMVNHLAALISVVDSVAHPLATYENNVLGTANVLLSFGRHGKGLRRKFLFSSTGGALYGNPKRIPANEKTMIVPQSPYALSKLMAEETIMYHAREFGFPYTILRYSNVYGPRQNPRGEAGVIAIFSRLMKAGRRPEIFGVDSTRDYVFVGDVVRANVLSLSKGVNVTMNIGAGRETSNLEVFDAIKAATGFKGEPIVKKRRPGEVKRISLDASNAKKILSWKPKVSFNKGVRITVPLI